MFKNELHYFYDTGEREAWRNSSAYGWERLPDDAFDDTPLNAYEYFRHDRKPENWMTDRPRTRI